MFKAGDKVMSKRSSVVKTVIAVDPDGVSVQWRNGSGHRREAHYGAHYLKPAAPARVPCPHDPAKGCSWGDCPRDSVISREHGCTVPAPPPEPKPRWQDATTDVDVARIRDGGDRICAIAAYRKIHGCDLHTAMMAVPSCVEHPEHVEVKPPVATPAEEPLPVGWTLDPPRDGLLPIIRTRGCVVWWGDTVAYAQIDGGFVTSHPTRAAAIAACEAWIAGQATQAVPEPDDPNRCVYCGTNLRGLSRVGAGDGTGQKFACLACAEREGLLTPQPDPRDAEIATLRAEVDRLAATCKAHDGFALRLAAALDEVDPPTHGIDSVTRVRGMGVAIASLRRERANLNAECRAHVEDIGTLSAEITRLRGDLALARKPRPFWRRLFSR